MVDLQYNESDRARVSLELSRDIIEALDKLRAEWGGLEPEVQSLSAC